MMLTTREEEARFDRPIPSPIRDRLLSSDLPSSMANASPPGQTLFVSQTRGLSWRASSLVTPTKSRGGARLTHHDSVSLQDSLSSIVRRSKSEVVICSAPSERKPLVSAPPPIPPPAPPPFPSLKRKPWRSTSSTLQHPCTSSGNFISYHTLDAWDQVFFEGDSTDTVVCTDDGSRIYVHSAVLMAISPVLKLCLAKELRRSRRPLLHILGVPFRAVRCFLRYLYSSRCDRSDMEECALLLLVLAHTYVVPALKRLCTIHFEQGQLNIDNVVDILLIARLCDVPRLYLLCLRRIISDFKAVIRSDGWRAMRHSDPALEQELIELVIRASMKNQDKLTKLEDDQVYAQLYDAMDALTHICRDGCRSIGSADKFLNRSSTICSYAACNRMESLVHHFADCKLHIAGGCVHCKRMWQLLELHSRMCPTGDSCKVPLCRHFKNSAGLQSSLRVELRWKMLVLRVKLAKRTVDALSVAAVTKQLERSIT